MTGNNHFAHYPSLCDRTVLITGGASGIGSAMVEEFAFQGAKVVFLDIAAEPAEKLIQYLNGRASHTPFFVRCDITDIDALQSAVRKAEEHFGPVRVLINNAANDDRHEMDKVTPECWTTG